ncbi:hypothetical protein LB572_25730 [Mesorhizobium sp. BH1-1-5]|uniref:hypothetical protein n=1 Tax=Mesorhizobium sp. BH1-1-5 TaxID=2876661 RepID=UPI001CC9C200|nr:hypothetical protein [Mesorhizobium sp. BH1-1-5]MBZ9990508.1 hypothetical protein [Mesorhizobium sp. BH1-1-5]
MARVRLPFRRLDQRLTGGLESLFTLDIAELATITVVGATPVVAAGRKEDLAEHLKMVRQEFVGKTEVEYALAAIIVLLRRRVAEERCWSRFQKIWKEAGPLLLERLNTRWLVSACDTIADHSSDRTERALGLAGSLLVNTVKLYETENWMKDNEPGEYERLPEGSTTLFDGVTPFIVGGGDMVANLNARLKSLCEKPTIASTILLELFRRLHQSNTVFRRFHLLHSIESTKWTT